ncbi:FCD domain-containing protein [Azospirillum brasilense]|nr:FCD domain-containing protein [Azospirillum brasilense]
MARASKSQGSGPQDASLEEVTAKAPLSVIAYRKIREAIRKGRYSPGDRVLEDEISRQLEMSRTPVREALHRLEAEGLLVYEARLGMVVARLDYQMIMELYSMRDVLEGTAAAMAARHASEAEVANLEHLLSLEDRFADDAAGMAEHNRRFHEAIYRSAHNRYLLRTLNALQDPLSLLSKTTFSLTERRTAAHPEHVAIVEAIRARDPERAECAARAHIRAAQQARLRIMAEDAAWNAEAQTD